MINYPPKYLYHSESNHVLEFRTSTMNVFEVPRFKLIKPIPEMGLLASANIYFDKWVGQYEDLLTKETAVFYFNGEKILKK